MPGGDREFGESCSLLEYNSSKVMCVGKQLKFAGLTVFLSACFKVSFGVSAPALSDRDQFPYFFRTVMPDSSHNPARIAFIRRFKWDTVTTFSQNEEVHSLAVNDLVTQLERANISCAATITFGEANFKDQLQMLRVMTSFAFQVSGSSVFLTCARVLRSVCRQFSSSKDFQLI